MKGKLIFLLVIALVLTACAAPSPVPTATSVPTAEPALTPTTTVAATDAPSGATPTSSNAQPDGSSEIEYKVIAAESQVRYEVGETFINQNNKFATAIGVTSGIEGSVFANLAEPQKSRLGEFKIDISQFKSDSSRRDGAIQNRWLESAKFPIAVFTPGKIEGLPEQYVEGQAYPLKVTGDLTVREATRPVTFDLSVTLQDDTLTGTASTQLLMSDFGVGPISIAGILNTEDAVKLFFDFVARPE